MSFGVFGLGGLAKAHQKSEIAKARALSAKSAALDAQTSVMTLEKRVDKLALISMTLWSLLSEKCGLSEQDLMERLKKIDQMDGQVDGKLQGQAVECSKCGRTMSSRHTKCLFCGTERTQITAFDDVV